MPKSTRFPWHERIPRAPKRIKHARGIEPALLVGHGDVRPRSGFGSDPGACAAGHRLEPEPPERRQGARRPATRRGAYGDGLVEQERPRQVWPDRARARLEPERGTGRERGDLVPAGVRVRRKLAALRQLDLPGPPVPRALDAAAGSVFPLPQSRRLDGEGAGAALEARGDEGPDQAGQARGAVGHPRIDRGAEILPNDGDDNLSGTSAGRVPCRG